MGLTAAVVGGSALLGTGAQMYSASQAAGQQKNAAASANALMKSMYDQTRTDLGPYRQWGETAGNKLFSMMDTLNAPFNPTMEQLEATPGYQFTRDQGTKALLNRASGSWGAGSGPLGKALLDYNSGLASQTFQQQFENYQTQNQNIFNRLFAPYQAGLGAAGQQVGANAAYGQGAGGNIIGAGNAAAAGTLGMGNALAQAPMNALTEYRVLDQTLHPEKYGIFNFGGYGGGSTGSPYFYMSNRP